ncbi:B-cell CLL/lymphoma 9 protein isoform 2-T4 [Discoglossus pictus]
MLELQEGRAHFNKRERNKKEKDEQKDNTDKSTSQKALRTHLKTPSPPKNLASPTASVTVSSGNLSMHSSNPKVRNSPSGNTQSSPKSKPEVMVHPPSVMSPSGNPQLDSKFSSQGKQGSSTSQSQASPCDPKSGNHTPKPLQGSGGSMGLKNGAGNGAKGKGKRERSVSAESFDQRDTGTPTTDSEVKDCNTTDPVMPLESQHAPHAMTPSNTSVPRSSTPSHGPTMMDSAPGRKTPSKVVYVFSTEMANKAAEAVIKGQAESIVLFHIQSTSNCKAERTSTPTNTQISTNIRNESKANPRAPTPQEQNHSQSAKVQPNQPGPVLPPKPTGPHCSLGQDSGDTKIASSSPANANVLQSEGCGQSSTPNNQVASPLPQGNVAPSVDSKTESKSSSQQVSGGDQTNLGDNPDGLSQEQLEHRERSLQTLRDIQRMLFPDEKEFALKDITGQSGGPQQNSGMLDNPQKKLEGPIQAMMAQSQNLGKGPGPHPDGGIPFGPQGHRDMPFSPEDMVPPPMNPQPGQDHLDHMTPEQVAWLKLQQEFYEEKRRKQEQAVVQQRSLQDMMVHQHGPRGMVRGPPPPYQMNPGESWGPGGPEPFPDGIGMPHPMPPKGMPPHPNVPGSQMQRLPGFVGMMNPDMEGPNVPNPANRPGLPGVNWPDEVPKIPDGRNFPPGQSIFSGPGRGERFPNPQGMPDEIFHQHLSEKQLGMPPGIGMEGIRPVMEMNRGMPPQRNMEPGSGLFPRMPGDAALSPSRMDFHKGMPTNMGPNREVEFGMGHGNMNMKVDMNLSVNMNSNQQLMSQKMREVVMGPDDMIKMRQGSSEMLSNQQKMHSVSFEHSQQEYGMGSRPFLNMPQGPGGVLRNPREQMGPDQRTNSRLSHMPPLPLNPNNNPGNLSVAPPGQRSLGRKPLDNVSVSGGQVNSPGVNPLKSPTMRQVQSPMLGSPSGNLKSPQTPSQLAGMLTGPTAAAAASIKSPPVMGSAAASPVHLKSPSLPVPSPGWTSSPKPPMQSPGIPPNQHKPPLGITSPAMMGNMESGMNMNPQNPKMPGSHGGVSMPTLSPMGMTQPLSHGGQMPSPNAMPPNVPHGGPMGPGMMPHNPMMVHGPQDSPMVPQGRMAFSQGFPPVQSPPQVPFPHNGPNGGHGNFQPGMGFPGDGPLGRPGNMPQNTDPALCKSGGPDSFNVMGNNMPSVFTDPDLQEVIRPGASGIPEFDLSRIIPSEKPSQTLQYFPRGEVPGRKPQQGHGFSHLPGMMGEPNPRMGLPMPGMGGPGPIVTDMPLGGAPNMPGHNSMRPPSFMQQGMMGPHHRMMSPAQSGLPGQLTMMGNPGGVGMMPGKERMPAGLYSHPGPVGSPNMLMSMQGMMGPQQNLMIPPQMRPRGMPTDVGMSGFSQGPGNPGNMMF